MSGRFVTFEGGEGSGKSTQIALLSERLKIAGITHRRTREPGGSLGAEAIRALLVEGEPQRWDAQTEALLHYAARRDHLVREIWPALERGEWVLCDRFADSTLAYQGYGHELGTDWVQNLHRLICGKFHPDLTVILDLPVEQGLKRAEQRRGVEDRYERMSVAFHNRVRQGFLALAAAAPERCQVIDASRSSKQVASQVWQVLASRFKMMA